VHRNSRMRGIFRLKNQPTMPSFLDDRVDSDAILGNIRNIVEIESPSRHAAGVNRVLETIARSFEGTGAASERELTADSFGDILLVRCDPTRNEPGILVLSHMDTVHPVGTLASKLTYRREGDRVYGPGIYDMKGGLMLAVEAFRRIAQASRRTKLPITFLFTPDEELSSPVSRRVIEREARGQRYVLVTEPARDGGKVVTERKGIGVFIIRTRGRPAHASGDPDKGRNAIVAMAEIVLAINVLNDPRRGITTNVGLIAGGTARNTVAEECMIEVDLRFCDPTNASEMEVKLKALKSSRPDIETTVTGKITRPPFVRGRGSISCSTRPLPLQRRSASTSSAHHESAVDRTGTSRLLWASRPWTGLASMATAHIRIMNTCCSPRSNRARGCCRV